MGRLQAIPARGIENLGFSSSLPSGDAQMTALCVAGPSCAALDAEV